MNPMITSNVAMLLLLCFALCLSLSPLAASQNNSIIAEACQNSRYKDLCISSLGAERAAQDASQKADLDALALIALRVASNNGSDTSVYLKKTLDTTNLEPAVEQTFQDCTDNYLSAMQQLGDSLSALVSKDYKEAKMLVEAAITASTSCDSELKQSPGNELELGSKNNIFLQLCTNALDILNFLAAKSTTNAPAPS